MTDDELMVTCDTKSVSKEDVKNRVDEYLTASKLGRMAFVAGDVQLAKDRFNLAMSLELQIELENNVDFGVTGGLLREELQSRYPENEAKSNDSDGRISSVLSRLQEVFEYADEMAGMHPKSAKWYSIMGSCLCVINEWDKAVIVYREGLKACPGDKRLSNSLKSLEKLNSSTSTLGASNKRGTIEQLINFKFSTHMNTDREVQPNKDLKPKLRPVNKIDQQQFKRLSLTSESAIKAHPLLSASTNFELSRKQSEKSEHPRSRSKSASATARIRRSSRPFTHSHKVEQHGSWNSLFSPMVQSLSLEGFNSRTVQTMRIFNTSFTQYNPIYYT